VRIGIDFDNTIVCYDELFHQLARERNLLGPEVRPVKGEVRDYLRRIGREDAWIELQGIAYGPRLREAAPFPGAMEFLSRCRRQGIECFVISHKTRRPFSGPEHDLHAAARDWLHAHGFLETAVTGLGTEHVFLELTKQAKLERIAERNCTHFIDDLPELLREPAFPAGVERLLFDPGDCFAEPGPFWRALSWDDISARIFVDNPTKNADTVIRAVAEELLQSKSLGRLVRIQPLPGGANNRVFRVESESGCFVLKVYFRHVNDPRDRLAAEVSFTRWAWERGLRTVSCPLAWDTAQGAALFEYIEGRRLGPEEVNRNLLGQAADFFREINRHKLHPDAQSLGRASESCFSMLEHLQCVDGRIKRLQGLASQTPTEVQAAEFVQTRLAPSWANVRARVEDEVRKCHLQLADLIPAEERCLSPSDFGFHNALLTSDGRLRFLDFEYAGWDDPAKTICDFFCQPAVPAPDDGWDLFVDRAFAGMAETDRLRARARMLFAVYRVKWCCILLNDFLAIGSKRRQFALSSANLEEWKSRQLEKARRMLAAAEQLLEMNEPG
jgi:thiamine kinase-like enzyme